MCKYVKDEQQIGTMYIDIKYKYALLCWQFLRVLFPSKISQYNLMSFSFFPFENIQKFLVRTANRLRPQQK